MHTQLRTYVQTYIHTYIHRHIIQKIYIHIYNTFAIISVMNITTAFIATAVTFVSKVSYAAMLA